MWSRDLEAQRGCKSRSLPAPHRARQVGVHIFSTEAWKRRIQTSGGKAPLICQAQAERRRPTARQFVAVGCRARCTSRSKRFQDGDWGQVLTYDLVCSRYGWRFNVEVQAHDNAEDCEQDSVSPKRKRRRAQQKSKKCRDSRPKEFVAGNPSIGKLHNDCSQRANL